MWRIAAAFSVMLAVTVPAIAVGADKSKPGFDEADANDDGKITIQEAKDAGVAEDKARRQDLNDDGKLTENDWKYVGYGDDASG